MKFHYNEINATKYIHCYILDSNTIINYRQEKFINHVKQSLINIDFNKKFNISIVLKVHAVFIDQIKFLKMTDNTSQLIKETEKFYIPIGKIIDLIFEETKPIYYENFLKLYQFMFSNVVWVIEPQENDHKGRKLWNICQCYNLCGNELNKNFQYLLQIQLD